MQSARDHMLCWNPNTDQVALVAHPDYADASHGYMCTGLACWDHVKRASPEQLKTIVFVEAYHLIVADGCDPQAVHRALWPLDEYRAGLAEDFPAPGPRQRWSKQPGVAT